MKKSVSQATGIFLIAFSSQSFSDINIAGTYSGTFHAVNASCRTPSYDGPWSTPINIIVKEDPSNPGDYIVDDLIIQNSKTGENITYNFDQVDSTGDDTTATLSGPVTTIFADNSTVSSNISGTAGTDFINANYLTPAGGIDHCTTSNQVTLIKTIGAGTDENNTATDTVHQAFAAGDNVMIAANHQSNNVKTRINTLKHRSSQPKNTRLASNEFFDASQLNISIDGKAFSMGQFQKMLDYELSGGSAGDNPESNIKGLDTGFGLFINGNTSFGDSKISVNQQGYNFDSAGVTLGGDYRFTDNFFMGLALGYNSSDTNYENNKGDLSTDTYSATLYTTYNQPNGYFIDFVARYGYSDINGQRQFTNTTGSTNYDMSANSNYSANDYAIDIETGWEFIYTGLSFQPYVRVSFNYGEMSAYQETAGIGGTTNSDLFGVDTQRSYSAQTTLGADLSYVFSTDYAVLIPRFNFEWHHEFLEDYARIVDSYALSDPSTITTVFNDTPDSDYFSIGGGLSTALPHGLSAYLNYNTVLSTQLLTSHNINGGVRWNF